MAADQIIAERGATHGDYGTMAGVAGKVTDVLMDQLGERGTYEHRLALQMIAVKLARIVSGDPFHADHWDDIAGYATLAAQSDRDPRPATQAA